MLENALAGEAHPFATFDGDSYLFYHKELAAMLQSEIIDLVALCNQLIQNHSENPQEVSINSGGVYRFVMECNRCEDILDRVHAGNEPNWAYFRKLVAMIKHSCSVTSNLQFLTVLAEQLQDSVEGNFAMANQFVLRNFYDILLENAQNFLTEAVRLEIIAQEQKYQLNFQKYFSPDIQPLLHLKASGAIRARSVSAESMAKGRETILYLVSNLLHSCDVIDYLNQMQAVASGSRKKVIKSDLHEDSLFSQCELFHSNITFFDTQCSQRQIIADAELLDLMNHVKVVYQLFSSFSVLMRIEERHYPFFADHQIRFTLSEEEMQGMIFDFFVTYIDRFRQQVETIARHLIQKYSVPKKIRLPIPSYRGFHVRPSTLVARIVMHYGSTVSMMFEDTVYNAAIPLDLFRANEVINAQKRRAIGSSMTQNPACRKYTKQLRKMPQSKKGPEEAEERDLRDSMQKCLLELLHNLQQQENIAVYDLLSVDLLEEPSVSEEFLEYVKREIAYLMATGKIDIACELQVTFEGDSRVLADIAILAEHGYGEDKMGNNIPLPKGLSYLRR